MFKLALFTQPRKDGPRPPIHSTEMKNLQPAIIWGRSLYSEKASPHELTPVAKFNHFSQKQSLASPLPPLSLPGSPPLSSIIYDNDDNGGNEDNDDNLNADNEDNGDIDDNEDN